MVRRSPKPPEQWFVADRPIANPDQDAFSHADVAANLRVIIAQAGEDERLMIGLLGPFGVGKSTVVSLLRSQFTDERHVVLRVSAERHELPGLHRSLIYALAEELVENKFDEHAIRQHLQQLEQKTSHTQTDLLAAPFLQFIRGISDRVGRKNVVIAFAVAVVLIAGVAVLGFLQDWTGAAIAAVTSMIALAGGLVPAFLLLAASRWLANLAEPGKATTEVPRVESADEFERTFADLVTITTKTKKKLIIALDDLDRLSPGEVLEGLNVIRSFQLTCRPDQRPVFIISADEEIIEAAIARSNPGLAAAAPGRGAKVESAQAFLDRLFTHRQTMPVHAGGDLTAFAARLLGPTHTGAAALGQRLQSVIEILIHDGVQDPRHVTRLLNGFFADYRLAMLREGRADGVRTMASGTVTQRPEALARITVFKIDFPRFYRALFTDEDLLARLEAAVAGLAEFTEQDRQDSGYGDEQDAADWARLTGFIGRSSVLEPVTDLRPFLYLGQDELDRVIGGREAREIRKDLVNRQFAQLQERLARLTSDQDRLDGVTTLIGQVLRKSRSLELANAVETLTRVLGLLPRTAYPDLAVALTSAFASGAATPQNTAPLVDLVRDAPERHIKEELARRTMDTGLEASTDRELVVLRGRVVLNEAVGPSAVTERLNGYVTRLSSAPIDVLTRWLEALNESPAPELNLSVVAAALQVLHDSDDDAPATWTAALARLLDMAPRDGAEDITPALPSGLELLAPAAGIIRKGLDTNASSIAVTSLARFELDSSASYEVISALTVGLEAASTEPETTTWNAVLSILMRSAEQYPSEAVHASSLLLASYLDQDRGHDASPAALALLKVLVKAAPASAEEAVNALAEFWKAGVAKDPNRALTTLNPLVDLLDDVSADSAATLTAQIVEAGRPEADQNLRVSTINALPLLKNSKRGRAAIDQLVQANIPPFGYSANATLISHAQEVLAAAYSVHHPDPAITLGVINTYRSGMSYQADAAIAGLSTITWPQNNTAEVLAFLANYPTSLTPEDLRGLIRQLANVAFELPPALLGPLSGALIVNGRSDDPEDRHAAAVTTAKLDTATMVVVALHVPDGGQIVERALTDDTTQVRDAVEAYVQTLNSDSSLHGLSAHDVAAAIQRAAPNHSSDAIGDLVDDQVEGTRNLAAQPWSELLQAITAADLQHRVNETANAALIGNEATIRNVRSLAQGLLLADVTWSDHGDRLLAALREAIESSHDEQRAKLLAAILKTTPATLSSARAIASKRYQIKGKKDAAAAADEELNS